MFGGGKKKIACSSCGAKNKEGERRCRVCHVVIDNSVEAGDRGFMGPGGKAAHSPETAEPVAADDGSFGISFETGAPAGADAGASEPAADVDPLDAIVIEAAPRNSDSEPPPPLSDETFDPNWLDDQRD